ncbi:hypothetical protein ACOSP7_001068 [Xanthoceras sorbifolium]|uniref:C2 domain-containing protein n=1 Tax=Xanthoceras sorbifolium TaxID=99658 RepID=A0ABQ8IMX5_9ROSI|nr:hypothetical protein JRO89_XS01G0309400 [Xanthoceras sorbifolium]
MSSRRVEITILSGENLRIDRKSVKKNAFVLVKVDPFNYRTTNTDAQGGSYPSWNEKLDIDLPKNASFITLEVQCKTSSGNRSIGSAQIPVSDFMGGYLPENYLHFLSYRLRDASRDKNGIINISVRVKAPENATCSSSTTGLKFSGYATGFSSKAGGLNFQGHATYSSSQQQQQPRLGIPAGEVATGIPIWCANRA